MYSFLSGMRRFRIATGTSYHPTHGCTINRSVCWKLFGAY